MIRSSLNACVKMMCRISRGRDAALIGEGGLAELASRLRLRGGDVAFGFGELVGLLWCSVAMDEQPETKVSCEESASGRASQRQLYSPL